MGAVSGQGDALVVLEPADSASDAQAALRAFLAQDGVQGGAMRSANDHGVPSYRAPFTAQTSDGNEIRGEALFLTYQGTVWRMLGYAASARWTTYRNEVSAALGSFAPVTDRKILDVQPRRIQLVTTSGRMTVAEFYQRYPAPVPVEEIARLNRMDVNDVIPSGTRMKRVVGDPLP